MCACSVDGCRRDGYSKGYCQLHYGRQYKHGTTSDPAKARLPLEERFWRKVEKKGHNDCWPWMGAQMKTGYGYIGSGGREGRHVMAHRYSYELANGPITDGLYILHSCDNPACVNPKHLRTGDAYDNTHDAIDRGRLKNPPKLGGHLNGNSKLTKEQVEIIKSSELKSSVLARAFGVSHSSVSRIRLGKTHVS